MKHRSALTLNDACQVPGQHLTAAAAAWLQRTNAAFAECTGVQVNNLYILRLLMGSTMLAIAIYMLLWVGMADGWTMLLAIAGCRLTWQCIKEFVRKGGAA